MTKKKLKFSSVLLFMLLLIACNKTKVAYWAPNSYGEKVKKSEENYKSGKKEGISIWWFINGNKQLECNYKDGKLNGTLKRWYLNGTPEREDNYVNDLLNGYSKTYYKEGSIESEVNYKNGLLDGSYKLYWTNGEIQAKGQYLNGLYDGAWRYFDETAGIQIGEAHFVKGSGIKTEFSLKSNHKIKEINFVKNQKNGIETWWNEEGVKIKEVIYKEDKMIETHPLN